MLIASSVEGRAEEPMDLRLVVNHQDAGFVCTHSMKPAVAASLGRLIRMRVPRPS